MDISLPVHSVKQSRESPHQLPTCRLGYYHHNNSRTTGTTRVSELKRYLLYSRLLLVVSSVLSRSDRVHWYWHETPLSEPSCILRDISHCREDKSWWFRYLHGSQEVVIHLPFRYLLQWEKSIIQHIKKTIKIIHLVCQWNLSERYVEYIYCSVAWVPSNEIVSWCNEFAGGSSSLFTVCREQAGWTTGKVVMWICNPG